MIVSFTLTCFFPVKKETQVKKLKTDKSRLEAEVDDLEKKVERMSTMQKQVRWTRYTILIIIFKIYIFANYLFTSVKLY